VASFCFNCALAPCFAIGYVRHSPGALAQSDCRGSYRLRGLVDAAHSGRASAAIGERFDHHGAPWFATVGLVNGSAVLSMYAALGCGPVTLVSPLIATYPLVKVLLSSVLPKLERIDALTIAAVTATVGGVALLLR
jgi:drug/metabolite transporter (DMT)-like permease